MISTALAYNVRLGKRHKKDLFFFPAKSHRQAFDQPEAKFQNKLPTSSEETSAEQHSQKSGCIQANRITPTPQKTFQALKVGFSQTWDISNVFLIHYLGPIRQKQKGRWGMYSHRLFPSQANTIRWGTHRLGMTSTRLSSAVLSGDERKITQRQVNTWPSGVLS